MVLISRIRAIIFNYFVIHSVYKTTDRYIHISFHPVSYERLKLKICFPLSNLLQHSGVKIIIDSVKLFI